MIEYKGLPLFGEDSNPRNTSKFIGLIGTFIVWFIFIICMIIIRPAEKEQRKYKDVQIVFEALPPLPPPPEPVIEEPEHEPVVEEPEPVVIEEAEMVVPEVVEKPKEKPVEKKTEPVVKKPNREKELSKKESERKPAPENQYKKPEETGIKETKKEGDKLQPDMTNPVFPEKKETKPVKKEFDWSMFDDEPAEESTKTNTNNSVKVEKKNDIKGTAAEGVTPNQQKNIGTKSKSSSDNPVVSEASGKTKGALSGIKNVTVKGDGGRSEISFKGSDDGGFFMDMGGGGDSDTGGRGIISPAKPTITLSDNAISEIDVTKSVTVHFTVLPDGNVVEVYITPASSLPPSVINEIKNQVSSWRFRSSIFKSQGEFKYTIKVN